MFDAIVKSSGWDDETAALQLLAHLEGDVFNVALSVPEVQRATQALTDHYRSPGRLAEYRRKFEIAVRRDEDGPSVFATELETFPIRAFGPLFTRHRSVEPVVPFAVVTTTPLAEVTVLEAVVRKLLGKTITGNEGPPTFTGPRLDTPIVTQPLPGTGRYSPDPSRPSRQFDCCG